MTHVNSMHGRSLTRGTGVWRLMALTVAFLVAFGCGEPADEPASGHGEGAHYFASPEEAVAEIRVLLEAKRWPELARYYDLSGTDIDRATLDSGAFFFTTERPQVAHPAGFWQYKHPFAPPFEFLRTVETDAPDVSTVVLEVEIEQGGGLVQRGQSAFNLSRKPEGWQIRPEEVEVP